MKLPNKTQVKWAFQFGLLTYMATEGFFWTYSTIWISLGVPYEWWAVLATTLLGILSICGLYYWIWRNTL